MASNSGVGEIEETEAAAPLLQNTEGPEPVLRKNRSVTTSVPEAEVHIYSRGKGPIDVIKMGLGGWDQDQLEVREILDKYGFKTAYAFTPGSGRGLPIRFNPRNGRSMLTYKDGARVYVDGEPKDSLLKPITRIILSVALITIIIVFAMKETPVWAKNLQSSVGPIPPWVLACVVIVFTRMRKRTKSFLEKYL
ncbi:uncharacterized protein LOC130994844 [Salvia miltiorrhiza]|uniref:uncharacterized protein LOC130994844 n=1 Tax=Salvia miltiorrhiza TaxID=226208 RepID=UPI0025AD92B1|nr:uncharacterized protein LOC130994844 [Salvia miltiorrhiza]